MDVGSTGLSLLKAAESGIQSTDKLVNILGGLCPFWGLEKIAVDACVDEIKKSGLPMEAKAIAIMGLKDKFKELKNQMAISDIAHKAATEGTDFSEASKVNDDWLSRFMDSGKHVSDEEVQLLWGNILAAEFENPESTPPSVIRILSEITPKYAKAFSAICSMTVLLFVAENLVPNEVVEILLVPSEDSYARVGLDMSAITELELLGLIKCYDIGYDRNYPIKAPFKAYFKYGADTIVAEIPQGVGIPIGCVLLTEAGQCISKFVSKTVVSNYLNDIGKMLTKNGIQFSNKPEIAIIEEGVGKDREYSFEMS